MAGHEWRALSPGEARAVQPALLEAGVGHLQLPYWIDHLRSAHRRPQYLGCFVAGNPVAYVGILTSEVFVFRFGLVRGGPVAAPGHRVDEAVIGALIEWAWEQGFTFLRFAGIEESLRAAIARDRRAMEFEPYPFWAEHSEEMVVRLRPDTDAMLAALGKSCRRDIRRAINAGYSIRKPEGGDAIVKAWPIYERHASERGFGRIQLDSVRRLFEFDPACPLTTVYNAYLREKLVASMIVLHDRDSATCYHAAMLHSECLNNLGPHELLWWTAIRDAAAAGKRLFSMGPPTTEGVRTFKEKFRPETLQLPPPQTVVLKKGRFRLWCILTRIAGPGARAAIRRLLGTAGKAKQ